MGVDTPHELDAFQPEADTLLVEDRSLAGGFIQLPRLVLRARNLSRDAKLLYALLLSYAWQEQRCFPGYRRLCDEMGASENAVRKYMRELEACHLLRQKRRGLGKTNIYTLCDLRTAEIEVLEPQKQEVVSRTAETEVPEPAKTEVELETDELETEGGELSKFRIESPRHFFVDKVGGEPDTKPTTTIVAQSDNGSGDASSLLVEEHTPADVEVRDRLLIFVQDFGREFNDGASVRSSTTRMANLYQKANLPVAEFIAHLYRARATTRERTAAIQTAAGDENAKWRKNRMGYFFSVLQNQLRIPE